MLRIILAALVAVPLGACSDDGGSSLPICKFPAGSQARETLTSPPAVVPIKHVIVVTNENRSFDQSSAHSPSSEAASMAFRPATRTSTSQESR